MLRTTMDNRDLTNKIFNKAAKRHNHITIRYKNIIERLQKHGNYKITSRKKYKKKKQHT